MESDNKSENGSDFEHVDANEEQQPSQFYPELLGDLETEGQLSRNSFNIVAKELSKIQEEEMAGLRAENSQFRAEIETMKTEKQLLLGKISALTSKMEALQSQIGEMQAKQKVVELEAKLLANEQMDKMVELKVNEANANLMEQLQQDFEKQQQLLNNKMIEENANLKKELQEKQREFNEQHAEKDKELENIAQKLEQTKADLGGKVAALEIQFLLTVHGEYSEDQVLSAMQVCMERPQAMETILRKSYELYKNGSNLHRHDEALALVLRALEMHLHNEKVQIKGIASIRYITPKLEVNQDTKIRVIQALIDGMENHQNSTAVVQNCCFGLCQLDLPQDIMFIYGRLATLLARMLNMKMHNSDALTQRKLFSLLNDMVSDVDDEQQIEMGKSGAIEAILQQISRNIQTNLCDKSLEIGWSFLWTIIDETPENCERFLSAQGLALFIRCYTKFGDKNQQMLESMIVLMQSIAEMRQFRDRLMTNECLEIFCKLLDHLNDHVEISYSSAGVLANLISYCDEHWTKSPGVDLSRDRVNMLIVKATEKWDLQTDMGYTYNSLKFIFPLLSHWHAIGSQHWAVWTLANLTGTDQKQKYCRLITGEGGMGFLEQLKVDPRSTDAIRQLADIVLKNVEDCRKLNAALIKSLVFYSP